MLGAGILRMTGDILAKWAAMGAFQVGISYLSTLSFAANDREQQIMHRVISIVSLGFRELFAHVVLRC